MISDQRDVEWPSTLAAGWPETAVLDSLGLAWVGVDHGARVWAWSDGAARLFGYAAEEMVGRPIGSIRLSPEDAAVTPAIVAELLATGRWRGEIAAFARSQQQVRLEVRASVVRGREGGPHVLAVCTDIGDRVQAQARAGSLEAQLKLAHQLGHLGSWVWDPDSDRLFASPRLAELLGVALGYELTMDEVLAAMPPGDRAAVGAVLERLRAGRGSARVEFRLLGHDGSLRHLEACCETVLDGEGSLQAVRGTTADVTARVRSAEQLQDAGLALRSAEEQISLQAALLDEIDAAVILTDADKNVLTWNAAAERLYGWSRGEARGAWLPALLALDGQGQLPLPIADGDEGRLRTETVLARKDGTTLPVHWSTSVIDRPGEARRYVGVSMDISERKAAEQALISARDYLRAVTDHMGDGLYTLDGEGRVTYMNRVAEDLLGWTLQELAGRRMHEVVRDAAATEAQSADHCPICRARESHEPTRVEDDVFICRNGSALPVAYTVAPFETDDGTGGSVVVFQDITARKAEAEQVKRDMEKLIWVGRIQAALRHEWFAVYGQPIVELSTGRVVQRELLIRMCPPENAGMESAVITPGSFLPVAEEYGFITDIDRWVVDRAAELAARGVAVELNVSARSISDPSFTGHVRAALTRTGADAASLVFEITETALISDLAAATQFVDTLHEMGCGIALDDFGTGYGGFTYLKRLPIDSLKIDIEFVRDLRHNAASRNVVEAVIGLARGFGLKTVAEGVEDQATLDLLHHLGVDYAQGYHLGRPEPIEP